MWLMALTLSLVVAADHRDAGAEDGKERQAMSTEITHMPIKGQGTGRRPVFGLIPGGQSPAAESERDTTDVSVSPRIFRDVQWEVARRWGVEPDDIRLRFGLISGSLPDRISAVRILGTGTNGHWVALLSPVEPSATPARVRVRAGVERLEPVAGRPLVRGAVLSAEDIVYESKVVWGGPKTEGPRVEPGWVVRRLLRTGEALKEPAVSAPDAVKSGQEVEIVWRRGVVAVTLAGIAMGSGPAGAEVRVRTHSGRQLRGVAREPGVVVVGISRPREQRP